MSYIMTFCDVLVAHYIQATSSFSLCDMYMVSEIKFIMRIEIGTYLYT